MPRARAERIERIVLEHLRFRDVFAMREAKLLRWVSEPHFPELLEFHRADASTLDGNLSAYLFCLERWTEMRRRASAGDLPKLVTGQDLIDLGLRPGPRFSQLLEELEDLVLERRIRSRAEAIDWVIERVSREKKS
jgi:poly(A) polymerase